MSVTVLTVMNRSVFQINSGDYKDRFGQGFTVVGRCSTKDSDLSSLPMWNIKFSDGVTIGAYPEEIIPSEMKENGCLMDGIENGGK